MQTEVIREALVAQNFIVNIITFTEEGYEIKFCPKEKNLVTQEARDNWCERIERINFEGFILSDIQIENSVITMTLVPKSFKEMNDFIWRYVEKYGSRSKRLADILGEATCVLKRAIDDIPNLKTDESIKEKAYKNFHKFEDHIF